MKSGSVHIKMDRTLYHIARQEEKGKMGIMKLLFRDELKTTYMVFIREYLNEYKFSHAD